MISTAKQRQSIGYFRKLLKLEDDTYREIIYSYNVESRKDLSYKQANELLGNFKQKAIELKLYQPKQQNNLKYEHLSGRQGFATPKQLRMLEAMWKEVSNQSTDEAKEKALNAFLFKIIGKKRLNFLTRLDVSKVIKTISEIKKQRSNNG